MRRRGGKSIAALIIGTVAICCGVADAGLITNGDFEQPGLSAAIGDQSANYRYLSNGDTFLPGWTVIDDGTDEMPYLFRSDRFSTLQGNYSVWLNIGSGVTTTFATVAGRTYELSMLMYESDNNGAGPAAPLQIDVAGFSTTFTGPFQQVVTRTYQFTAGSTDNAASLRLFDASNGGGNFAGYKIDAIDINEVESVPLPTSAALGIGLLGLVAGVRLVRRRGVLRNTRAL